MFHLGVYTTSQAASFTDLDTPAVQDPALTISNNHYIFTIPSKIIGAYGLGATLQRMKIQTPKTRQVADPYVQPIEVAAAPPQRANFADLHGDPINLNPIDETKVLLTGNPGVATQFWAALWVSDGNMNATQGDTYTIRGTATIAGVANAWAAGAFTLDQTLPAGRYTVVGMRCFAANLLFARLIFPSQVWRPGVIGSATVGVYPGDYFQRGYLGDFGSFISVAQPQLEVFVSGASASQEVYLDVIKVG